MSGDDAWVSVETQFGDGDPRAGRSFHKVKLADVTPIDTSRPLKVGEPCLATSIARIEPCKVTKIIDGGIAYIVSFGDSASSADKEWEIGTVASAPKDTGKPATKP
ncbi:hypothetical protein [Chondromyces apiculatus]|uniref:Uncharacterized protein n=1 Tax=Chondromyces apiculatus DSM 436 TaxID=1192034 RepID=A0A017TH94_9BACT|nr:hypothetical protein [Chondromyces apiculatus]EYF08297.1 Hypothetical protein CAP_6058 [Chondromyces apiculatus DSM 436]